MSKFTSEPLRIYLERADGRMYTGNVMVASLSINQPFDSYPQLGNIAVSTLREWEISLAGIGELTLSDANLIQLKDDIEQPEWRCSFCGVVMPKAERKCEGCGAWRSFVYDL